MVGAGAQASPLQSVQLADSCLAMGNQTCQRAIAIIQELEQHGRLGEGAAGAKVVYAQTDSVSTTAP